MTSNRNTRKMSILIIVSFIIMAFSTLACKDDRKGGSCDITGPNTALTTCLYNEVK